MPMYRLFSHYLPGPKHPNQKLLYDSSVHAVGFVLCEGKDEDRIDVLFDLLAPPEHANPDERELSIYDSSLDTILSRIIEFSLVHAELFFYGIKPAQLQYKKTVNDRLKKKAVRAMIRSRQADKS